MSQSSEIFKKHYQDYLDKIGRVTPDAVMDILGIQAEQDRYLVPFLGTGYRVSANGITDPEGQRPSYGLCVILARYILNCPPKIYTDTQWVAFRDFKQTSHFTNVNYFASDTEQAIVKHFSGNPGLLARACEKAGGHPDTTEVSYDLAVSFQALPRIGLRLLFNDKDEEFDAQCKVLFHRHSEFYLDPESLAMTGAALAATLKKYLGDG